MVQGPHRLAQALLLGSQRAQLGLQGLALLQRAAQASLQLRLLRLEGRLPLQRCIPRTLQ